MISSEFLQVNPSSLVIYTQFFEGRATDAPQLSDINIIETPKQKTIYENIECDFNNNALLKYGNNNISEIQETKKGKFSGTRKPGIVSKHSQSKIIKAVSNLCWLSGAKKLTKKRKYLYDAAKVTFLTLTLPSEQQHSDNEIKSICLNQFLTELRTFKGVKFYVWRAEKSENGNLHFHILLDRFIPYMYLRSTWNRCINKLSYVDRYTAKMHKLSEAEYIAKYADSKYSNDRRTIAQIKNAYQKGKATNWNSPNSIDIHTLKKARSVEAYVSKYISKKVYTKEEDTGTGATWISENIQMGAKDEKIQGNIWSKSETLPARSVAVEMNHKIMTLLKTVTAKFWDRMKVLNNYTTIIKVTLEELIHLKLFDFFDIYQAGLIRQLKPLPL